LPQVRFDCAELQKFCARLAGVCTAPEAMAMANARLSSSTGEGATWLSASQSTTIRSKSVAATEGADAWAAAIAACRP